MIPTTINVILPDPTVISIRVYGGRWLYNFWQASTPPTYLLAVVPENYHSYHWYEANLRCDTFAFLKLMLINHTCDATQRILRYFVSKGV